jgi:CDP-diacylglycerol--serine O-phosphatidyltransferase
MKKGRINRVRKAAVERLEDLSFERIIPSALTLGGLCSGLTAIRFSLEGEWKPAVAAIVCAAMFDALDGRAARMLGADSRFGAQIDSLADMVSFGVAPAMVMYSWSLSRMGLMGWAVALAYCVCCAIRLARFNIQALRDEGATPANPYFTGLPTPGAAALILLPILLSFEFRGTLFQNPMYSAAIIIIASPMMISRLPTPSIKYLRLPRLYRPGAVAFSALLLCLAVYWPWSTLIATILIYVATIPVGAIMAFELHRQALRSGEPEIEP